MQLLIDENKLQLLLEQKKQYIGKRVAFDSVVSSVSFLISVALASYREFFGIPGVVFKTVFILLGVYFTIRCIYDAFRDTKDKYDHSDLLIDINNLNEITHNHSIVVIKDSFHEFPNRFLVYEDNLWGCELFLNYKDNVNNEAYIKNRLSSDLKIPVENISLDFVSQEIHEKFSESAKKNKMYCHKFYSAEVSSFPDNTKEDTFTIDGKVYHWRTISDLESDEIVMKKNSDIVGFVKGLF